MTNYENQRGQERVNVALPVRLGKGKGLTRDVSASGISFEVDVGYETGSEISFVIEFENGAEKMLLKCSGNIVRTEDRGGKKTVAVELSQSVLNVVD